MGAPRAPGRIARARCIAPVLGVLIVALIALLSLASTAGAGSNDPLVINSFTYDPLNPGMLTLTGANTYSMPVTGFGAQESPPPDYTNSNIVLSVDGMTYDCSNVSGGTASGFNCPGSSIPPGASFSVNWQVTPDYEQGGLYAYGDDPGFFSQTIAGPTPGSCPPVTITPTSLPSATDGDYYSQQLTANPSGTYTFTTSAGSLPPGLTLSPGGALSGTPTAAGTYMFTVTAAQDSCTGSQSYTLTVAPLEPLVITKLPYEGIYGQALGKHETRVFDFLDTVYYEIVVSNPNHVPVDVTVTDKLPPGLSYEPENIVGNDCTAVGQEVTCKGTLSAGSFESFYVTCDPDEPGVFANSADVVGVDAGGASAMSTAQSPAVTFTNPFSTIRDKTPDGFQGTAGEGRSSGGSAMHLRGAAAARRTESFPIRRVQIALLRLGGGGKALATFASARTPRASCEWLRNSRAQFSRSAADKSGGCENPLWLLAKGTTHWSYKLLKPLAPGKYVLYSRATDTLGVSEVRFTAARRNRVTFTVR